MQPYPESMSAPESDAPAHTPPANAPADDAATSDVPVVRISPLFVFGLPPFWCIATCPTCDAAGFIQEDIHPLPPAPSSKCAYGHTYTLELETDHPLDADFLDDEF
jgi:hypothetical protein